MTPAPEKIEDAERAEFWRLTHEALRRHPEALDRTGPFSRPSCWTGSRTTDRSAASPYLVTISMVTRSRT
jgi:hypothetical protein